MSTFDSLPSTTNKIERWWRDLNERMNPFFKSQLLMLLNGGEYNPHNGYDRQLMAYVYIPIVQRECDQYVKYWNTHRIRLQDNLKIPTGVPDHMFEFPEEYNAEDCSTEIEPSLLRRLADESDVLDVSLDLMLDSDLEAICRDNVPNPEELESRHAIEAYRHLKSICKNVR